jgi:hypothetical protein
MKKSNTFDKYKLWHSFMSFIYCYLSHWCQPSDIDPYFNRREKFFIYTVNQYLNRNTSTLYESSIREHLIHAKDMPRVVPLSYFLRVFFSVMEWQNMPSIAFNFFYHKLNWRQLRFIQIFQWNVIRDEGVSVRQQSSHRVVLYFSSVWKIIESIG